MRELCDLTEMRTRTAKPRTAEPWTYLEQGCGAGQITFSRQAEKHWPSR